MELGSLILKYRKKYDLSQEDLAREVGVTRQTISKWELNETSPDLKQAIKLAEIFNINFNKIELLLFVINTGLACSNHFSSRYNTSKSRIISIMISISSAVNPWSLKRKITASNFSPTSILQSKYRNTSCSALFCK